MRITSPPISDNDQSITKNLVEFWLGLIITNWAFVNAEWVTIQLLTDYTLIIY